MHSRCNNKFNRRKSIDLRTCGDSDMFLYTTLFRNHNGNLIVPYLDTDGGVLKPNGNWLGNDWNSSNRVVLLPIIDIFFTALKLVWFFVLIYKFHNLVFPAK